MNYRPGEGFSSLAFPSLSTQDWRGGEESNPIRQRIWNSPGYLSPLRINIGVPGRSRTCDLRLRKPLLLSTELLEQKLLWLPTQPVKDSRLGLGKVVVPFPFIEDPIPLRVSPVDRLTTTLRHVNPK